MCAKACEEGSQRCEALESWALRLDTELVYNSDAFLQDVQPGPALADPVSSACPKPGACKRIQHARRSWRGTLTKDKPN